MTVAAYDSVRLVVDGLMLWGNQPLEMANPKAIICGAWVIAMAGDTRHIQPARSALKGVTFDADTIPLLLPLDGDAPKFEAMAISRDKLCFYQGTNHAIELDMPLMTIGCGGELALGAMEYGADALDAVRIAIKHDRRCGPPIYVYQFNRNLGEWAVDRLDH